MNYYLIKSDPDNYSWEHLIKEGKTCWDGIRNYQARNYLKNWENGDLLLFYHSGQEKSVVGVARVCGFPYPELGQESGWYCCDIEPVNMFNKPVQLDQIRKNENLRELLLLKQSRLSVMPVQMTEFDIIVALGMEQ